MKTKIISFSTILILTGCGIPKEEHEKIKHELETLKTEVETLKNENSTLEYEKEQLEEKKRIASTHTENEALKLLEDYYEFYNSNFAYRSPKVRRENENTFVISLEQCVNKEPFLSNDFHWSSKVVTLEIFEDGKYEVR
jgi:predicted nuclease with TOPRIM domain